MKKINLIETLIISALIKECKSSKSNNFDIERTADNIITKLDGQLLINNQNNDKNNGDGVEAIR